jgi:cytosine/adenosine deaminase-related metal-dependent hydrolase
MLERAMHLGLRNNFRTDEDVEYALRCCTYNGAAVLGLAHYGLAPGDAADLVLVAAESVAHAVVSHPVRKLVMKGGEVVVRDGRSLMDPP